MPSTDMSDARAGAVVMTYSAPPEVLALAKQRIDKEDGDGTWDALVHDVFCGAHTARRKILDKVCTDALRKAANDIADVLSVLPMSDQLAAANAAIRERDNRLAKAKTALDSVWGLSRVIEASVGKIEPAKHAWAKDAMRLVKSALHALAEKRAEAEHEPNAEGA